MSMRSTCLSIITAAALCAPALAAECPADPSMLDDALQQAPSCTAAYQMFQDCGYGSSIDVSLGATVQEKCEAGFLGKLDAAKKSAYLKQIAACDRKYAHKSGTIYLSPAAFCSAGVARDYAKKYAK